MKNKQKVCRNCGQIGKAGTEHSCPHDRKCDGACKEGWPCSAEPVHTASG